ncbi:hypothetical protein ACHAXS_007149 [Conticribra weissflogii]
MPNFFALSDIVARIFLAILPSRISNRIKENTSPLEVLVLRTKTKKCNEPRMTLFEGVFATILFDLALFGTYNPIINGIISLFTTIQNSWDTPFKNEVEAEENVLDFCNRLDIQQHPWIWEKQPKAYKSLNDFFSRTYASENFPAIGEGMLVSPACCKILIFNDDTCMKSILIKGCNYQLERVGLPHSDLKAYRKNRIFLGYLSPKDYHRVHAPISGKCIHCKMEGENVDSASVKFFGGKFNLMNENKRLVVVLEDDKRNDEEPLRVALVIIGGVGVNTITYDKSMVGKAFFKGEELSTFRAGGSAFALFSTKPLKVVEPLINAAESQMYVEVLIGETLAQ